MGVMGPHSMETYCFTDTKEIMNVKNVSKSIKIV